MGGVYFRYFRGYWGSREIFGRIYIYLSIHSCAFETKHKRKIPSCKPLAASTCTVPIIIQHACLGYPSSSLQGSSSFLTYSHLILWCTSWLPRTTSQHYLTQLKFCPFRLDSYSRKARARSYIRTRHSSNPIIPLYLITIGLGTKTKWRLT